MIDDVVYELEPDLNEEIYMPHPKHRKLPFKGNHHQICDDNPGPMIIGLHKLRKALNSILENRANPDPKTVGLFVLYLCEGPKLPAICEKLSKSIVCSSVSRLDKDAPWTNDLIRSWSHFSEVIMRYVDYVDRRLP